LTCPAACVILLLIGRGTALSGNNPFFYRRTNMGLKYNMSYDFDVENMVVTATLKSKDEETEAVDVVDTKAYGFNSVHENLRNQTALYGLSKLIQDRSSDVKAGPDKLQAMQEVLEQLTEGKWEKARVVGAPTVSAEVEALAEVKGISIPDAQKALRKYDKAQREQILGNPAIVERAKAIRARREEAEDVSLDDLVA